MLSITIENITYQVEPGQNLLQACLALGFDIPYYCWHPAMHSVGACRQCAVKLFRDEKDTRGRIVMSCMTPVADGMRISIDDAEAKSFRKSIAELLMLNHPHDCPVCDEGGECHLQDMVVMTGQNVRRTRFPKRTHLNQDLGPFVNHEMNRCIGCYRCVRFYRTYAGGRDFNVFGAHDHIYFGRHADGPLESPFSGNLVEVCPTGVFTDKTFKQHPTRKWDLQTAPSICAQCGLGCNTIIGERYGTPRRVQNRWNPEVNGHFLCDRGRFGHAWVNSAKRTADCRVLDVASDAETTLGSVRAVLARSATVIGIGSPAASLEANFALRELVGPDHFYSGIAPHEHELIMQIIEIQRREQAHFPSLSDIAEADAVLALGEDLMISAPMADFALRQADRSMKRSAAASLGIPAWDDNAVSNAAGRARLPFTSVTPRPTGQDELATRTHRCSPNEIAAIGDAVASILRGGPASDALSPDARQLAAEISSMLRNAARPLIIAGTGCGSRPMIDAAASIASALSIGDVTASLCYIIPECNSIGVGLLGGRNIADLLNATTSTSPTGGCIPSDAPGGAEDHMTIIVLENDLSNRLDPDTARCLLQGARTLIVLAHTDTGTTSMADIRIPVAAAVESHGTYVNNEGRAQRAYQVYTPKAPIQASWKWLDMIAGNERSLDQLTKELGEALPLFSPIASLLPTSDFRIDGMKIPRQTHRFSGRMSMHADQDVREQKPPDDPDSPLAFTMEGSRRQPPAQLVSRYWEPGWNSVQAHHKLGMHGGGTENDSRYGIRLIGRKRAMNATESDAR